MFELTEQARAVVRNQEYRIQPYFSGSGFPNLESLKAALIAHSDDAKELTEKIESENVEFAMDRAETERWWISNGGFYNDHVLNSTKTSNLVSVTKTESSMIGQNIDDYLKTDDQLKPTYGYLRPTPEDAIRDVGGRGDIYIFRKSLVRDRLTWTTGTADFNQVVGFHLEKTPQNWRGFFIPWKYRLFITPDILDNLELRKGFYSNTNLRNPLRNFRDLPVAPKEPRPPSSPRLVMPVMPEGPVLPALPVAPEHPPLPVLPPRPPEPLRPVFPPQPVMTEFRVGDGFMKSYNHFIEGKEYQDYLRETERLNADYQSRLQAYNQSDGYVQVQKKREEIIAEHQRQYEESATYKAFQSQTQEIETRRTALEAEFRHNAIFKHYEEEVALQATALEKLRLQDQDAMAEFYQGDIWKSYVLARREYLAKIHDITQSDEYLWAKYRANRNPYSFLAGTSLEKFTSSDTFGQIQLQYWGPLSLEDVEVFEFRDTPPTGEFLEALMKRGIKIRDGRRAPGVR